MHLFRSSVLIIYCCVQITPKPQTTHIYYLTVSVGQESGCGGVCSSSSGSQEAEIKALARDAVSPGGQRKTYF